MNEMDLVSGGTALGGMYSKDAHDGPGGLYGPGGSMEDAYQSFNVWSMTVHGMTGMEFMGFGSGGITLTSDTPLVTPTECPTATNTLSYGGDLPGSSNYSLSVSGPDCNYDGIADGHESRFGGLLGVPTND